MSAGESPSVKVRFAPGLLAAVDQAAQVLGCDRSECIRLLLFAGLANFAATPASMSSLMELEGAWKAARKLAD